MEKNKTNTKTLSVKISKELFNELTNMQHKMQITKSELVRKILEDYVNSSVL